MQQVKSENNNLVGRLTQSDEKTASFKSLLQKLGEQLRKVEKENKDLKIAFQVTFSCIIQWAKSGPVVSGHKLSKKSHVNPNTPKILQLIQKWY